jgi:TRAP-type C4-dicarboxylate transport system permease small subunit
MIQKVQLKPMSGFMHGFFKELPKALLAGLIIILLSLLFAYFSANKAQKEFNNFFSPETLQSIEQSLSQESSSEFESTGNETIDAALKTFSDASGKLKDNPLTDAYNNLTEQYTNLVEKVTTFGERSIFWITFAFSFLFALMLLNKVNRFIKALTHKPDPSVEDNIKALAIAVNQLIDQQNSQANLTRQEKLG